MIWEIYRPYSQKWQCQRDTLKKLVTELDERFDLKDKGKTQVKSAS